MRRYTTRPEPVAELWHEQRATNFAAWTVHEREPSERSTELLDARGNRIFAVNEMEPIGFQRLKERP